LADVHSALAYYFDHREESDRQAAEDHTFADSLEAELRRARKRAGLSGRNRKDAASPR